MTAVVTPDTTPTKSRPASVRHMMARRWPTGVAATAAALVTIATR